MSKQEYYVVGGIIVIIALILGTVYYNEQKIITGNAITNLERQLEEQGELSAEQEKQLEELAEVTCKDVQVPYSDQESYYESEPYAAEECNDEWLAYNLEKGSCVGYKDNLIFEDEPARYSYTINNLDNSEGGNFQVDIGFSIGGQSVIESQGKYIYPSSSHTFYVEKMAEIDNCYFKVTSIPTKRVCETVTKYKDVLKYRTVTKYRTETICD